MPQFKKNNERLSVLINKEDKRQLAIVARFHGVKTGAYLRGVILQCISDYKKDKKAAQIEYNESTKKVR